MASVNIEELFDDHRLPASLPLVAVILYFPVGVVLALIRFFIGFHTFLVACILPKSLKLRSSLLRMMCSVLGLFVTQTDVEKWDKNAHVLIANYTTTLDHLAIGLVVPNILPSVWDLPPMLMWMLGYKDMGAKQGRETLIRNVKTHCQTSPIPVLAFPEGASTNGRKGLLKFSVWPFSLDEKIQPIIVNVSRPYIARVSPSVLGGRWWIDLIWFLFVPYTIFSIRFLSSLSKAEDETEEEYARRGQELMAGALGVMSTVYTSADKVEYAKRKLILQTPRTGARASGARPAATDELGLMVQQVHEVLPHVPYDVIRSDLGLTKDVDLTITNLLEGRVEYEPVEEGVEASPAPSPPPTQVTNQPSTFGKTFKERQLTFEERKKNMIENARRRYMEKHGMIA